MFGSLWTFIVLLATVVGFFSIACLIAFLGILLVHLYLERRERQEYDETTTNNVVNMYDFDKITEYRNDVS